MKLSKEDIKELAELARLSISEDEIDDYQRDIVAILDYVKTLQRVKTQGGDEMAHAAGLFNVLRTDEGQICDPEIRQRILDAFPRREGDLLESQAAIETHDE